MENKTIEALEKLLSIKDETIKELEKQIQLLKNHTPLTIGTQPINVPYTRPCCPDINSGIIVTKDGFGSITLNTNGTPIQATLTTCTGNYITTSDITGSHIDNVLVFNANRT